MSSATVCFNSRRERVLLGDELGRGGEGTVFSVEGDANAAAKLYTGAHAGERKDKILAIVSEGWAEKSPSVAFPKDALYDSTNNFVGFTMRRVGGQKPIHSLYSPTSRKTEFPKANFRFLVRVAVNVAKSVAKVHSTGCVIGDINHSGILVAADATVTLIDCDSFQVATPKRIFNCKVGVAEFTPPELQGKSFAEVVRTPNHDAFGLAILMFSLLFMGRHPFAGRYSGREDMSMEKAITEFRFAYSARKSETQMDPPPNVPTLADIPPPVAAAFEKAFGSCSVVGGRPRSDDWVSILAEAEKNIVQCSKSPAHQHFADSRSCPWCRMEKAYPGFLAFALPLNLNQSIPVDIGHLIASINEVPDPGRVASLRDSLPAITSSPNASRGLFAGITPQYRTGLLASVLSLGLFFFPWPSGALGISLLGFGVWHAFRNRGQLDKPIKAKAEIEKALENIEVSWSRVSDNKLFEKLRSEADELILLFRGLSQQETRRLADLVNKIEEAQRCRFLERFFIADAKIRGVGESRKLTLVAEGVETAADVDEGRILGIPGFGPATASAIVAWQRSVEKRFRFDRQQGVDPHDVSAVKNDIAHQQSRTQAALAKQLFALREQSQRVIQTRQQLKTAAEPLQQKLALIGAEISEARAKLPSEPQKWLFGLTIVAMLFILANFNGMWNRKQVGSLQPSASPTAAPVRPPSEPKLPPSIAKSAENPPERTTAAPTQPHSSVVSSEVVNPTNKSQEANPALTDSLLDLRSRENLVVIQKRLSELGYLTGQSPESIDGRTTAAIKDFKTASLGRLDDSWDLATQLALQARSAIKFRDSFLGSWSEGVSCRTNAIPDVTITSRSAKSSAGGVCHFHSVGVARTGWDIRTTCYNGGEQRSATVQFTVAGDILMWRGRDGSVTRYARC